MNKSVTLGSGLEMVIVDSIDFEKDSAIMQLVKQGVSLQERVFKEQKVSFPEDRVLLYEDSVGTRKNPGSLCEGKPYHHLYLTKGRKLIGMRVTQEFDDVPEITGLVSVDYFPALVLPEACQNKYDLFPSAIGEKSGHAEKMTPVDVLLRFSKHLKHPESAVARFNDGLGLNETILKNLEYAASEVKVPVPSMAASRLKEYNAVIDEITIFGKFNGMPPLLSQLSAERLLVKEYLIAGYVNSDDEGHILDSRGRQMNATVNDLECVNLLRQRISNAVADHGCIFFKQI